MVDLARYTFDDISLAVSLPLRHNIIDAGYISGPVPINGTHSRLDPAGVKELQRRRQKLFELGLLRYLLH